MKLYQGLKKFISTVLPKSALFKLEIPLRKIYALGYSGSKYQCNICNKHLSNFVALKSDRLCPSCGSLQRTRRLWDLFNEAQPKQSAKILDFSPSRSLFRKFKSQPYNYTSTDLSGDFIADQQYDITKIEVESNAFDIILCYHVLEHIERDKTAMEELYRVLKPCGTLFVQTPFKDGSTYENPDIKSEAERLIHFGQEDHVRIYSATDLKTRLISVGFEVEVKSFEEPQDNLNGFAPSETVLVCRKG